ncbi:TPA: hemagglutinin repeat-containing protein [Campylobacter coli]|nr:hemagglutinin repeat-containing protein [Campylobacter coli]
MEINKKKIIRMSLNLTLLSALFPCVLLSADLRQRDGNVIVSRTADLAQSSNKTDVINIKNPNQNGVSHNQFDEFSVKDGVIFNNSLKDGNSQIGGWVERNPNLKQNANTIINEILSKQASGINGAVEVFGQSANLIFANENGFSVNGAAFLNTKGVTLSTGKFNGNFAEVTSNGRVAIGEKGVMVDGDYFNVISRGIDIAGSIAHYQKGKNLSNINFIAGLNKVDLNTANSPKILESKQKDEKINYGIDGKYLGSMYANTVTLVSTEEGVGVRHSGVIRGIEDVIVKVKDKAEFQAIGVNANGSVKIDAKDIKTSLINADKIDLKASGKVTNEGLYKGKQIQINANDFENAKQVNFSQETKDIFDVNQENSKIYADTLALNTLDKTSNFGFINALNDIKVDTKSFDNQGEISANKDISLTLNDDAFANSGKILSQKDIQIQANKDLTLNHGNLYAQNLLHIKSLNDLNINSKLENASSINLDAKNIHVKNLVASGKELNLHADENLVNDGYLFSNNNLKAQATTLTNNSTFNSLNDLYLDANTINNNALIFANKDVNIEANILNNNANLIGSLESSTEHSQGFGQADYGDTAFKRWNMDVGVSNIVKYNNLLDSKQASIQAGRNVNINTQSQDNARQINNSGKILAQGDIVSFGNIDNKSLSKEVSIKEVLEQIKVDGFFAKEYLGSWNTNSTYYFVDHESLLDALRYFSTTQAKNHQRESAWNALKDAAAKNSTLNQYFSLLFGADYASKRFVPDQKEWNLDAKIVFKAKSEALIASKGKLDLNAKEYNQGLVSTLDKNFALVESDLKKATNSRDLILNSIPDLINSGLFTLENKTKNDITYEYTTNTSIVDENEYFGFSSILDEFKNKNVNKFNVIGDSFFENQLINAMYANALQSNAKLSKEEIKRLLKNGAEYANANGLNLGQGLIKNKAVDKDMILYVLIKQNGKNVMAPMLYLSEETIANNQINSNLAGKSSVNINAETFNSLLGGVTSDGKISITADNKINLHSSSLNGESVNLNANNVNIDTVLGIDEKGSYSSIKKGEIKGNSAVSIDSVNDLNIKNSDISTSANDSKIALESQNGNVNITNDYSKSSSFEQVNTDKQKSNIATTTEGVLNANINGANVEITSNKDVNIIGSNINADSKIDINANNVNIKDAHENSKVETNSIYLSPVELTYKNTDLEISKSIGSTLNSKGDININTNSNIAITGSTLQADKSANLNGNNITIENGENKISSSSHSSTSSIAGYRQSSANTESSLASSSKIQSDNLNLNAQKNVSIKGSELSGNEIDIKADKVDFAAGENKTHTESDSIAFGVFANANLELAGNGLVLDYNFAQDKTSITTTKDSNGRSGSDSLGSGEIGLEISKNRTVSDELSHASNTIKGANININANNTLDIGGANFEADKDINLKAGDIASSKYEDVKTENSTGFSLYAKEVIEAGSPIASVINQSVQNAAAEKQNLGINYGIVASQVLANAGNLFTSNLISADSKQTVGLKFNHDKSENSSENISKMNAGGNLNLESTKGNIVLNGVEAKGDRININAKGDVVLNAAKSKNSSSDTSLEIAASNKQIAGYHLIDGGTVSGGVEGYASASHSKTNETKFTNTNLDANNININTGKDFALNGANVKASNDATLNIGGNLEVNSLADSLNSQKYSALLDASGTGGLSSNHVVTGSLSGTLGIGYGKTDKATVATQSGISAGNEISGNVNGDLNLKGGILNSDSQKGNLTVNGQVTNSEVSIHEKSDGATVRFSGGADKSFAAVVDIDDHISKEGGVNSAVNIGINNKDYGISKDTQNTTKTQDNSWAGGTINLDSSISKIKDGISKITGSKSTSEQPSSQPSNLDHSSNQQPSNQASNQPSNDGPYINESTNTTRL